MFRWGATAAIGLGLAVMTACSAGAEEDSPYVSYDSKPENRGADGESNSEEVGGPAGSGDHETDAQQSGDRPENSGGKKGGDADDKGETGTAAHGGKDTADGLLPKPGPFDPTAPGFELFDPCSDTFKEQVGRAGVFEQLEGTSVAAGSKSCVFSVSGVESEALLIELASSDKSLDQHLDAGLQPGSGSDKENNIYVLEGMLFDDSTCSSFRETSLGTLIVSVNGTEIAGRAKRCEYAVHVNKTMLEQLGDENAG